MKHESGGSASDDSVTVEAGTVPEMEPEQAVEPIPLPGPDSCKRYTRERLAQVLPAIVGRLIHDSLQGELPALKMILQIADLEDKDPVAPVVPHHCKSLEQMLMEDWLKETVDEPSR